MGTRGSTPHGIPEVETERMYSRTMHTDVFKLVQEAKCNFGNKIKKVQPTMYVIEVATIPVFDCLSCPTEGDSEVVENYLQYAILYETILEFMDKRKTFSVVEDDFGPTLERMLVATTPSYASLVEACRAHSKTPYEIEMHIAKSNESFRYFTERGVPEDDGKAFALAIAFYTGLYSAK